MIFLSNFFKNCSSARDSFVVFRQVFILDLTKLLQDFSIQCTLDFFVKIYFNEFLRDILSNYLNDLTNYLTINYLKNSLKDSFRIDSRIATVMSSENSSPPQCI